MAISGALPTTAFAASACAPATTRNEIVPVIEDMFGAVGENSLQRLTQATTADFYAYDGGKRMSGPELMQAVHQLQVSGKHLQWSVTKPEIHVACDLAWMTYVNQGFLEDSSGRQDLTWLESAILAYANGRWRIQFLQSTRVSKDPQ